MLLAALCLYVLDLVMRVQLLVIRCGEVVLPVITGQPVRGEIHKRSPHFSHDL